MRYLLAVMLVVGLFFSEVRAQDTLFGEAGSGQPTRTVLGILGGAAAGAAIGEAAGGHDGWWIGALTGSTIGGLAGNQWGAAEVRHTSHRYDYHPVKRVSYRYHSKPRYRHRVVRKHRRPVIVEKSYWSDEEDIPYGYLRHGKIRSPWSDFEMSVGGKHASQVLYDSNTGQPFRVP